MGTPVSSGNRGVLALGASLARLCLEAAPSVELILFGSNRDEHPVVMRPLGHDHPIRIVPWRLSPRGALRHHLFVIVAGSWLYRFLPLAGFRRWLAESIPWIGALEKTTLVGDVRGGDSFSDIYGLQRFLIASLPVMSVIWVKGGILLFPQTYGPYKSRTAHWVARWILRRSTAIIARDLASQTVAQDLVGSKYPVLLSPDVAFALHVERPTLVQLDGSARAPLPTNIIGLNVNGLMYNGGYNGKNMFGLTLEYKTFVKRLVIALLQAHKGTILLVPHTYAAKGDVESDNDASGQLKRSLPLELQSRVRIVTGEYDAHQLKGIIGQCSFFVGSRMHSCIAALSQGVPCVGVAYSMKFRGVFESVGRSAWVVDARSESNDSAVRAIENLYSNHASSSAELGRNASLAREKLSKIFSDIVKTPSSQATRLLPEGSN